MFGRRYVSGKSALVDNQADARATQQQMLSTEVATMANVERYVRCSSSNFGDVARGWKSRAQCYCQAGETSVRDLCWHIARQSRLRYFSGSDTNVRAASPLAVLHLAL